ncbi:unnamed protein product [Medioppia subpectinata]|uniref:Elongation of very long chain fatty acids protein n=1 Tax=Medioppia subpectinata TaxID=1979941 RepID=A0A7R9KW30_9ACAR|nr:unnamed protein product [Medioppia subpectinata]CAG2110929.1 unnamed protein product [Medioppia subpectinata]
MSKTDDRLKEYPLLSGGPELFLSIMLFWLLFVTKLGPNYMRDRKPFVLREIIMIYNFILVVINAYFVYASLRWLDYFNKPVLTRLPARNEWSEKAIAELPEKAFYAFTKLFDLFDTVFFVLRKKSNQITFLHVYHHFMVPVLGYMAAKLCPQTIIVEGFCFANSIVHTVMYSYYLLSAFGPQIQPYLWWKRYITRLQLIQFAMMIYFFFYGVLYGYPAIFYDYPLPLQVVACIQPFVFFYLFLSDKMLYVLHDYWINETDDRIKPYFLLSGGPELFLTIMFLWLIFVTKLGPNFMRDRKPFVLREIIIIYNFILVVISAYFTYASIGWLDYGHKSWDLKLPERNQWSDKAIAEIPEKAFYFYTKLFDLFDSVFFVLRKKSNQLSFLHVYHHFMVPVLVFLVAKLSPQTVAIEVFCLLNSIVHTVMYSYYLLSAFGPQIQPYLWWKRYITRLQLIQFAILIVYVMYSVSVNDLSGYAMAFKWLADFI